MGFYRPPPTVYRLPIYPLPTENANRRPRPPEQGKANKAIVALLGKSLSLKKSQIELLSGDSSPRKRLLLRRIAPGELAARIEAILGETST